MKKSILLFLLFISVGMSAQVNPDGSVKTPPDVRQPETPQQNQTRRTTNSSIGIGIDIGGIIRSISNKKNCNQLEIIFPPKKAKFTAKVKAGADGKLYETEGNPTKPSFRWTSSKPDQVAYYVVELVRENKREKISVYQAETDQAFFAWPEDVPFEATAGGSGGTEKVKWEFFVMAVLKTNDKCQSPIDSTTFEITNEIVANDSTVADGNAVDQQQQGDKKVGAGQITEIKDVNATSKMPPRDVDKPYLIKQDTKNQKRLIAILPANNSHFESVDEIDSFTWELQGEQIPNPNYIVEITKLEDARLPQKVYTGTSSENRVEAKKVAKFSAGKKLADTVKRTDNTGGNNEEQAGEGQYSWKVTETTTGISSNTMFFTIGSCDVDLQITDETIECLGYEGANKRYKICFSATYQSNTGDLTFNDPTSGLFVYDQANNPLNAILVGSNTSLQTQPGAGPTTVNYCFEVLVNSSVTSIGFGMQGDDLDPTPIVCQPGASLNIDTLPNCLCDSCDAVQTDISNFTATTVNNSINLSGSLTANVPIYGIEVQVVSYSYNAQPNACSAGVASLEQSGMILLGQSTINNSTQLQAYNLIGTPNNTNATKTVKYMSNGPMNGSIPISLDMGLPMPLAGLDAGCCTLNYRVCLQFKVYTERGLCKSCTFTTCVDFTN
ncbi:MAG: hypothetical protein KKC03_12610 [Bacteroidetes bacterium]|nr:hypothetical protein [Bacteroidota bacterium]